MDRDLARSVIKATFQSARPLQDLLPVLQARLAPEEYRAYAKAVAAVIAEGGVQLLNRVFAEHPDLEAEVDSAVGTTGNYE
jgi:hypothetical protein